MPSAELIRLIDGSASSAMSDDELASKIGVDPETFASWRRGSVTAIPMPTVLQDVARFASRPYRAVLDAALRDAGYIGATDYSVRYQPEARAQEIEARWGDRLRKGRQQVEALIASEDPYSPNLRAMQDLTLQVESLANSEVDLKFGWNIVDPSPHGHLEAHQDARLVLFMTYPVGNTPQNSDYRPRWWPVPDDEVEDWVHAALGPAWFDYCYRVATTRGLVRHRPTWYCVFVDRDLEPFLAPEDFAWNVAGSVIYSPATRQKLRPRTKNRDLETALITLGDVVPLKAPADAPKNITQPGG